MKDSCYIDLDGDVLEIWFRGAPGEIPPTRIGPGEKDGAVAYEQLRPYVGKNVEIDFDEGTVEPAAY